MNETQTQVAGVVRKIKALVPRQVKSIAGGVKMRPGTIHVTYEYPPIPDRSNDWMAVEDNYDGPGSPLGIGPTPLSAIGDLLMQLEERKEGT